MKLTPQLHPLFRDRGTRGWKDRIPAGAWLSLVAVSGTGDAAILLL